MIFGNIKTFKSCGMVSADLEKYMGGMKEKSNCMNAELKEKSSRMKELQNLIRYVDDFKRLRPLYEELNAIKFRKKRDAFYAEHESELRLFYLAKRKLDAVSPDHKFPVLVWKKELKKLAFAETNPETIPETISSVPENRSAYSRGVINAKTTARMAITISSLSLKTRLKSAFNRPFILWHLLSPTNNNPRRWFHCS